jgi:hypothetical protein
MTSLTIDSLCFFKTRSMPTLPMGYPCWIFYLISPPYFHAYVDCQRPAKVASSSLSASGGARERCRDGVAATQGRGAVAAV